MAALHPDADMAAQLERTLIGAYVGAADLGEALAVASRVEAGDYDAWHRELESLPGKRPGLRPTRRSKPGELIGQNTIWTAGWVTGGAVTLFSVPGPWCRPA